MDKKKLDKENTGQWKELYIECLNNIGEEAIFKANLNTRM